jgi:GNAT superfamily N-acetyltransferase
MIIRGIKEGDGKGGFSCGEPTLDAFLSKRAYGNDRAGIGRAYVILESEDADQVLGFYTLSSSNATPDALQPVLGGKLPKYPLPVTYIGMFAVTKGQQGKGLGTELMVDAMRRSAAAAAVVGSTGLFLHSRDAKSTAFYEQRGFTSLSAEPTHRPMFMPMGTVHHVIALTASRDVPSSPR